MLQTSTSFLEIALALVLILALLSTVVYSAVEWHNHKVKARGQMLKQSIYQMLSDPLNLNYGALLFSHPMVMGSINSANHRPPQYLDSKIFAACVLDIFTTDVDEGIPLDAELLPDEDVFETPLFEQFKIGVLNMNESPLKELLLSMHRKADTVDDLSLLLRQWYEAQQDRVSGWYKTKQLAKTRIAALLVVLFFNVDAFHLYHVISQDEVLRNKLVETAEELVEEDSGIETEWARNYLKNGNLPLGWSSSKAPLSWLGSCCKANTYNTPIEPNKKMLHAALSRDIDPTKQHILFYFFGLFVSWILLSAGAPFWYDVLVKLVNIRRAGNKPKSTT